MTKLDDILARLYDSMGFSKDFQFCEKYNIKANTLSTWKKREKIPYELLQDISQNENISMDWLLNGKGDMFIEEKKEEKKRTIIDARDILEHHITDKELEILQAYRSLPKEKQEWYYFQLKADQIKYKKDADLPDAKYA